MFSRMKITGALSTAAQEGHCCQYREGDDQGLVDLAGEVRVFHESGSWLLLVVLISTLMFLV